MANYEIFEGHRKGSVIYQNGPNTYMKDKDTNDVRYLSCVKYKDGCSARAKIDLDSNYFSIMKEHDNHESTEREIEVMKLKSKLKRKSEYSQGTLREIFDDEVNQSEVGGFISFAQLENTMYKRKRLCTPQVPSNTQNAVSLMEDSSEEFKMYYAFSIEELDEVAIAFMSPKWKNYFHPTDQTELQADATFYVAPKQFYQLLNIFLQYKSHSLPAIHILMSTKTCSLYDKVVAKVIEILPFIVTVIKTDYERSLYCSFAKGFPDARVSGCLFHHDRALYKTGILKNGLSNSYKSNLEFRQWVELLMCLPLLPADLIFHMFSFIKQEKPWLPQSEDEKVMKLLKYYERYWLGQVGPSRLSVFHTEKRTTNDLESFHANLKRKFKSHNPNYRDFIKNLNKVIQTTEKDFERIDNDVPIRRRKRPVTNQKEICINVLQQQLINGDITPNNYLKTITHQYRTQFKSFEDLIELVEDADGDNETEDIFQNVSTEQNLKICRICLVNVPDTLILPCRHAQTCFSCTERVVSSDINNCPICREPIENFLKIFL